MRRYLSTVRFVFLILPLLSLHAFAEPIDINLKVEFQEVKLGKPKLLTHLSNDSQYQIDAVVANPPWINALLGIQMYAFGDDFTRTELPQIIYTGHSRVSMKAGTSIDGEIDLAKIFPTLQKVRKHRDVVLFWTYKLSGIKGNINEVDFENRFGGMIVIPSIKQK